MSLILDALNRTDREQKNYQQAPSFNAEHGHPGAADHRLRNILIGVVVALGASVVVLVVLLLTNLAGSSKTPTLDPMEPAPMEPAPAMQNPAPVVVETPAAEPTAQAAPATAPATSDEVLALYATDTSNIEIQPAPPVRPAQAAAPTTPANADDLNKREQEALAKFLWQQSKVQNLPAAMQNSAEPTDEAANQKPAAAPTPPAEPTPVSANSIQAREDVPFLHNLPVNFQNTIPTLIYADHNFEAGTVIINKKRIYVGDYAADGVALEGILDDGVILSFNDRLFKLSSLNSWVNY